MSNAEVSGSVTGRLSPHTWSNEETAAYEAAVEAANGAVGAYSALIAAEESKAKPNAEVIAGAQAAQQQLAREREGLRSSDRAQIAAARTRYAEQARTVLAVTQNFGDVPTASVFDIFAETSSQLIGQYMALAQAAPDEAQREQWRGRAFSLREVTRQVPARDRDGLLTHIAVWQAEITRLESQ